MTDPSNSGPFVRADVRAFLDQMAAAPRPPMSDAFVAQVRQIPPEAMPSPDLPVGELGTDRAVTIPGPAGDIRARLFDPRPMRDPSPVVVFFHGGGFVLGGIETHAGLAASIARGLDLPVVSIDYRLAPEHPWPAAPDDAEAAARWIAANGAAFDRDFTGIVLCGDSAGGALVAVTALALRDRPAALPALMHWLIYPLVDKSATYPSATLFGDGYGLESAEMRYFDAAYAPDAHSWRHSALLGDQAGLPPTLVVTAGLDPLRDQGRAYAAKLADAGVDVTWREYPGTIHGFATFRLTIPSARGQVDEMIAMARAMLVQTGAGA